MDSNPYGAPESVAPTLIPSLPLAGRCLRRIKQGGIFAAVGAAGVGAFVLARVFLFPHGMPYELMLPISVVIFVFLAAFFFGIVSCAAWGLVLLAMRIFRSRRVGRVDHPAPGERA